MLISMRKRSNICIQKILIKKTCRHVYVCTMHMFCVVYPKPTDNCIKDAFGCYFADKVGITDHLERHVHWVDKSIRPP